MNSYFWVEDEYGLITKSSLWRDYMNNFAVPANDGQAPARRIGAIVAFIVIFCGCACMIGLWAVFAREGIEVVKNSIYLESNGVITTGTITDLEKHSGVRVTDSPTYTLVVEFEVDGKTYTLKSYTAYRASSTQGIGDPIQVRYDPANPETAQIDTFEERWLFPVTDILP
jgi:hypothetical protein